jgi:hypothetical protein
MKLLDFSKTNNNTFISCLDGNIKVTNLSRPQVSQNQIFNGRGEVDSVSYSHDGNHVIYVNENKSKLNVITNNNLINSHVDTVFTFQSDLSIIDYKLSPILNIVAILFISRRNITVSIDGVHAISPENRDKIGLRIYDFTPGSGRLIYEKYEEDLRGMSFSEDNKFAICGSINHLGENKGIIIVDLHTGAVISARLYPNTVDEIYFYPNDRAPNRSSNRMLIIFSPNDDNIRMLQVRDTTDFRIIFRKQTNVFINDIYIEYNGLITLATDQGFFTFLMGENNIDFVHNLNEQNLTDISFSQNGNSIGFVSHANDPMDRLSTIPDNIIIYNTTRNRVLYQSNPNPGRYILSFPNIEPPFIENVRIPDEQELLGQMQDVNVEELLEMMRFGIIQRPIHQAVRGEAGHADLPGVAFEIHNAFSKINLRNLVDFVRANNLELIDLDYSSPDAFLNNINSIFTIYINTHFSEASPDKKRSLIDHLGKVLSKIRGIDFDYEMNSIDMLRWEFLKLIISFVMKQEVNFVENYLDTFIEDSYRAYSSAAGDPEANISCPKGIIERFVLSLHSASVLLCPENFSTCPSPYKELIRLLCSAVEVHINWGELQQDWYRSGIGKIPLKARKQNFIEYMKKRANEICPDDNITIEKIKQDADIWEAADLFSDENVQTFQEGGNVWLYWKYV